MQAGDTGVKSVESVTVVTASTGWTGGSWAVVIAKPLVSLRNFTVFANKQQVDDFLHTGIIKVHNGSSSANTTPFLNICVFSTAPISSGFGMFELNLMHVKE